jgi:lipoprotein-anchoring transpeptidase ErfK/SrfK
MWRRIVKLEIVLLVAVILLVFTLPILAEEIDERGVNIEERIISGLPENQTVIWSGSLPENKDKEKIKKIVIKLSEQKLYLYENQEVIGEFLVSTGKPGYDTPVGEFMVYNRFERAWSSAYGLWMPFWMAVAKDGSFGIHELPEWPGGYKEGLDHLGIAVSHGCIRLGLGPAEIVYNWAEIGTPVVIIK